MIKTFEEWCGEKGIKIEEVSANLLSTAYKVWGTECYHEAKKAEHRADVAERAFLILWNECKEKLGWNIDCTMWYAKQAEKELAEGKKDKGEVKV